MLSMLLQRLYVLLLVLYLTSIQPNANEKITFDSVWNRVVICKYGPNCFDSDLFLKIISAYKEWALKNIRTCVW